MTHTPPLPPKPKPPIWRRWWAIAIYVFIGVGIIGNLLGYGNQGSPAPARSTAPSPAAVARADCQVLEAGGIESINEGTKTTARAVAGVWLPLAGREADFGYTRIARVQVTSDAGLDAPAVFLLDEGTLGPNRILAGNETAREHFTWGEAAQPGSPIATWRDRVLGGDLVTELAVCPA